MDMQKALHLYLEEEKKNPKFLGSRYAVFEKYDGWYFYADWNYGEFQGIFTSAGRRVHSMALYETSLRDEAVVPTKGRWRIIFEGTIPDLVFSELNGQFNQRQKHLTNVIFKCHDLVNRDDLSVPFLQRYANLKAVIDKNCHLRYLELAPILAITHNVTEWYSIYEEIIADPRREGVILKHTLAPYAAGKRNYTLMKIKCELTLDLLVIDVAPGKRGSKYENTLGYLVVQGKDKKKHQISGMTDAQRTEWILDPSKIVGKVVEVVAMKKLENGSLREPRFKAIRYDKTEKDTD